MKDDNTTNTKEVSKALLKELYLALPEKTRAFLKSQELQKFIEYLEHTFHFSEEESAEVQKLILLLLLTGKTWEEFKEEVILALRDKSSATIEKCVKELENKLGPYIPKKDEVIRSLKNESDTK